MSTQKGNPWDDNGFLDSSTPELSARPRSRSSSAAPTPLPPSPTAALSRTPPPPPEEPASPRQPSRGNSSERRQDVGAVTATPDGDDPAEEEDGSSSEGSNRSVSPPPLTASGLRQASPLSFLHDRSLGASSQRKPQQQQQEEEDGNDCPSDVASAPHRHHRELFRSRSDSPESRPRPEASTGAVADGDVKAGETEEIEEVRRKEGTDTAASADVKSSEAEDLSFPSSPSLSSLSTSESGEEEEQRGAAAASGDDTNEEPWRAPQPPKRSDASAALTAAEEEAVLRSIHWRPCKHSHGAPRYRNTPGYYCTYCTYSVCQSCFADIPDVLLGRALPSKLEDELEEATDGGANGVREALSATPLAATADALEAILCSPATAVVTSPSQTPAVRLGTRVRGVGNQQQQSGSTHPPPPQPPHGNPSATGGAGTAAAKRGKRRGLPRCHLCKEGYLKYEEALLHEWCCEGPAPDLRVKKRGRVVYDTAALQRYYFMKEQREKREASGDPLVATYHGALPPPPPPSSLSPSARADTPREVHGGEEEVRTPARKSGTCRHLDVTTPPPATSSSSSLSSSYRSQVPSLRKLPHRAGRPCCEERGGFVFSVENPRLEQVCVWCAVNTYPRETHPAFVKPFRSSSTAATTNGMNGDAVTGSVTPLLSWRCPPSLPGLPPRRFALHVPYGAYGLHNIHGVALYLASDIFRKATTYLTAGGEAAGGGGGGGVRGRGRLAAALSIPSQHAQPLLVVEVLHRIASSPLVDRQLLFPIASQGSGCGGPPPAAQPQQCPTHWPEGLASEELALCVDHLVQGRSVAVGGLASKWFFLSHVAHSAELMPYSVTIIDASRGRSPALPPGSIARQLREAGRELHARLARMSALAGRKRGRDESAECHTSTVDIVDVDENSNSNSRGGASALPPQKQQQQQQPETREEAEEAKGGGGCSRQIHHANEAGHPIQLTPLRSWEGTTTAMRFFFPLSTPSAPHDSTAIMDAGGASASASGGPSAALCPVRAPPIGFATAAVRKEVKDALAASSAPKHRRCVRWLALPSCTAGRLLPADKAHRASGGGDEDTSAAEVQAAMILVIHNVDLLDADAQSVLLQLCNDYGHPRAHLRLLLSYDDPNWASGTMVSSGGSGGAVASAAASLSSGLDGMCLVHLQLRSLLLPRVHEMRLVDSLALLTQSEAAAAGGGGGGGSSGVNPSGASSGSASLPLHDTVRRVLKSLPDNFRRHLAKLIDIQELYGEHVHISVHAIRAELEKRDVLLSAGFWASVRGELTSNRLAHYDSAENALLLLQPRKLRKVLEEVEAERKQQQHGNGLVG